MAYTAFIQLSQIFLAIGFFHFSEYHLAIKNHGKENITLQSLLISPHYILAMLFSVLEYLVEYIYLPGLKELLWFSNLGLSLVIIGEIIRKLAILTAGSAFTHLIKTEHEDHHKLIKHGVYGVVRHPGYCGFLIWSVGTQIMLVNPISTVAFTIVVWRFFADRVPYEETYLRRFFGYEYWQYSQRVPSGIPFVR